MKKKTRVKSGKMTLQERNRCGICGNAHLDSCLELPRLPVTGVFSDVKPLKSLEGIDQRLLWCSHCGQGQLARQVAPSILYDSRKYSFRTSTSATARSGTAFFIDFISKNFPGRVFECAIDVGCNDLYLLQQIKDIAHFRVGIDPIWAGRGTVASEPGLKVLGVQMEQVDADRDFPIRPDLVLCRHTIEHIYDPLTAVRKMMDIADEDAVFIFETPSFENLINRGRFDQVFHEHLQYFSPASFEYMLAACDAHIIGFSENYHDWGAMLIAFKKGRSGSQKQQFKFAFRKRDILRKYALFQDQMSTTFKLLNEYKTSGIYGFGAAMMLPVLAYHLRSDLSFLKGIVDDDPSKDRKYYINLKVPIRHSAGVKGLDQSTVFITAVDNVKLVMTRLLAARPKHVIYPFHVI